VRRRIYFHELKQPLDSLFPPVFPTLSPKSHQFADPLYYLSIAN
jgi:hypothetical protein